ncbi:MAG: DUF1566 domain-containing protein [Polyangia bacterium]
MSCREFVAPSLFLALLGGCSLVMEDYGKSSDAGGDADADTDADSDADADTDSDADTDCECTSADGPCCDGCHFYSAGDQYACENMAEYGCSQEMTCGADAMVRGGVRYCTGGTAACEGEAVWNEWVTDQQCGQDSYCLLEEPGQPADCMHCPHGCDDEIDGLCYPECDPHDDPCCSDTGLLGGWYDSAEDICWENPVGSTSYTYADADLYCDNLEINGFGLWRLPTIDELRGLVVGCSGTATGGGCGVTEVGDCLDESCGSSADCLGCSEGEGGGTSGCYWSEELEGVGSCGTYWSSSLVSGSSGSVWCIDFLDAHVSNWATVYECNVRCVRAP